MFCRKCGKEIDNNSKFCPYCGREICISDNKILLDSKKSNWKTITVLISVVTVTTAAVIGSVFFFVNKSDFSDKKGVESESYNYTNVQSNKTEVVTNEMTTNDKEVSFSKEISLNDNIKSQLTDFVEVLGWISYRKDIKPDIDSLEFSSSFFVVGSISRLIQCKKDTGKIHIYI